jgi:hypothetical protein
MEGRLLRVSALTDDGLNVGNLAGVAIVGRLPAPGRIRKVAAEIGFSETVLAAPDVGGW